MANKAYFISVPELKRKSIIDGNVDADKLMQFIEVAQDMHLQNYLGTNLYRHLQGLITGGTLDDAANSNYKDLLVEYIKPMLVWYSQVEYLPFAMFQIQNGGVYKHSSEKAETVTLEEMRSMLASARDKAEFYTKRFVDYACDNTDLFPEYNTTNTNSDMISDNDVNFTGWVI